MSLTASHHELDLDALDRLSVGAGSIARAARTECRTVAGAVVLATCNRFELYLDVDAGPLDVGAAAPSGSGPVDAAHGLDHAVGHVADLVAAASGVPASVARDALRMRSGPDVAHHLFAVAAGLDSMVVGEREIAGQVKRSLTAARAAGTTSKTLELLFQTASRTSKRVATRTSVGAAGRSLVSVGLELAARELPGWPNVRALLVGTGSYAGAALAALRTAGCRDVAVYSRSGRAAAFVADRDAVAATDLVAALAEADLVVACSGTTSDYVLDAATLARAGFVAEDPGPVDGAGPDAGAPECGAASGAGRIAPDGPGPVPAGRSLVVLDLALRRDVDPAVAGPAVTLLDLAVLGDHAPGEGREPVEAARRLVADAAAGFERTRLGREADAAVVALLDAAEERIAAEVAERLADRPQAPVPAGSDGGRDDGAGLDAEESDAEVAAIVREVRRRVHAGLHPQIVAVREGAISAAQAGRG